MKYLRNYFALAMIVVMLVGSFDASAKTKRTKSVKSKAKTSKTTKPRKSSYQSDYDLEYFKDVVTDVNTQFPKDIDEGLVAESITMEGTKIYYNYIVSDDEMVEFMRENPDLFAKIMKSESTLGEMREAFDDMLDAMIKLGITINVRFYAEGVSKPILNVPITAKEVRNGGY